MSDSIDERMQLLERKANVVRSRLLRAVDALDERRHQIQRIGEQAKSLAAPVAIGVLATAALLGASALSFVLARRRVRTRSLSWRLSKRIQKMDLVRQPTLLEKVLEKVTLTAATLAMSEIAKRLAKNTADGRLLGGRLAVGNALAVHHDALRNTGAPP
jgi:hypothetical protein